MFEQDDNRRPGETAQQSGAAAINVPPAFLRLAEAVICHSDPSRFGLLYKLLYRLRSERHLLDFKSDADVAVAHRMLKSVSRDYHKMTAFVRFKEIALPIDVVGRRRFMAWFEPDHFIVERVAPFFQRRFNDMDWIITTPHGSASWMVKTCVVHLSQLSSQTLMMKRSSFGVLTMHLPSTQRD